MGNKSKETFLELINELNKNHVRYVVLRDGYNQLPDNIRKDKDIDILVNNDDYSIFQDIITKLNWTDKKRTGWYHKSYVFLYQTREFNQYQKNDVLIDIRYQLVCRSINWNEWIPLDMVINESVWKNRKKYQQWYVLSDCDLLIHLLTHGIFDKMGHFEEDYVNQIRELFKIVNHDELKFKLTLVFFKFTDRLIQMISEGKIEQIRKEYISFSGY